ncbi:MAG: hypothetical protein H7226_12330 [Salinibacterium sp.]|nr:hypothetical protein [Salinibacterium sp.]
MKLPRLRILIAVLLVAAVVPTLAACSLNPVESIIEQATGGDVDLGGAALPEGFPTEVPLVDGEILFGGGMTAEATQVWNVTIRVTDAAAFETVTTQLTDAGFVTSDMIGGTTDAGSAGTFQSNNYNVSVLVSTTDTTVNYTVTAIAAPTP